MLVFIVFALVAALPLLINRFEAKRAADIHFVQERIGGEHANIETRKRQWQAKKAVAVMWTCITVAGELLAFKFVDSLEGALITVVFAGGLGYLIASAFEKPIFMWLDSRAATVEIKKIRAGGKVTVTSQEILVEGDRYRKTGPPLDPYGHGTGGIVDAIDTDLVEPSQHHLGGR